MLVITESRIHEMKKKEKEIESKKKKKASTQKGSGDTLSNYTKKISAQIVSSVT